jgi:hypothetical protein
VVGCAGVCSPVCVRASLSLFLLSPSLSAPSYLRPSFCARVCQGKSGEKGGEGGWGGGGGGEAAPDAIRAGERHFGGRKFEWRGIITSERHLGGQEFECR